MMAQSCSKSSFAFAFFIALRDNNNGISEGTTSVRIIFFSHLGMQVYHTEL